MAELLPPFAKNTAHVSEPAIGVIWFVFSAVVAIGQLPVVKLVEGKRRLRGLALMSLIWAGTFIVVMAAGAWLTGTQAAVVLGVAVAVFALAECLHGAIYAPLAVDHTPANDDGPRWLWASIAGNRGRGTWCAATRSRDVGR